MNPLEAISRLIGCAEGAEYQSNIDPNYQARLLKRAQEAREGLNDIIKSMSILHVKRSTLCDR